MRERRTQNQAGEEKKKKRRRGLLFFVYLSAVTALCLCLMTGWLALYALLGYADRGYTGRLIDNILLSPVPGTPGGQLELEAGDTDKPQSWLQQLLDGVRGLSGVQDGQGGALTANTALPPRAGQNGAQRPDSASDGNAGGTGDGIQISGSDSGQGQGTQPGQNSANGGPAGGSDEDRPGETERVLIEAQVTDGEALQRWDQQAKIDLFYRRAGEEDNTRLKPGSAGYYLFRLTNGTSRPLQIKLRLTEESRFRLPLKLTLTPLDENNHKLTAYAQQGDVRDGSCNFETGMGAHGIQNYVLEWRWAYSEGEAEDARDTALGIAGGRYILRLDMQVETDR